MLLKSVSLLQTYLSSAVYNSGFSALMGPNFPHEYYLNLTILLNITYIHSRGLVRNFNSLGATELYVKTFAGATGPAYLIKLKILRVPKYTSQNFEGARHPWHPF